METLLGREAGVAYFNSLPAPEPKRRHYSFIAPFGGKRGDTRVPVCKRTFRTLIGPCGLNARAGGHSLREFISAIAPAPAPTPACVNYLTIVWAAGP